MLAEVSVNYWISRYGVPLNDIRSSVSSRKEYVRWVEERMAGILVHKAVSAKMKLKLKEIV